MSASRLPDDVEHDGEFTPSELQLDLLRVLWRHGDATAADVVAALAGRRDLAHTTVATLLTRLVRRGVVGAERDGRQWRYRALLSERQVRRSMVGGIVRQLFRGNPRALVAHLLHEREVDADDLERVRALLDEADPDA